MFTSPGIPLASQELPTVLACTSNAKAGRDYGFIEAQWSGVPLAQSPIDFGISTKANQVETYSLKDKVFSSLHTASPVVRSITPASGTAAEDAVEFSARVVARTQDAVFLVWTNDFNNKVWTAAIDLTHRKATVAQVFQGATSLGGEIETLDCR